MLLLTWIALGLIVGFGASKTINETGFGMLLDAGLGIVGAVTGGGLFNTLGFSDVAGFNLYGFSFALAGAALLLMGYHIIPGD